MTFGSEMEDNVRLNGFKNVGHGRRIANIGVNEREVFVSLQVIQRGRIGRIGQFIDHRAGPWPACNDEVCQSRANESGAAGH